MCDYKVHLDGCSVGSSVRFSEMDYQIVSLRCNFGAVVVYYHSQYCTWKLRWPLWMHGHNSFVSFFCFVVHFQPTEKKTRRLWSPKHESRHMISSHLQISFANWNRRTTFLAIELELRNALSLIWSMTWNGLACACVLSPENSKCFSRCFSRCGWVIKFMHDLHEKVARLVLAKKSGRANLSLAYDIGHHFNNSSHWQISIKSPSFSNSLSS